MKRLLFYFLIISFLLPVALSSAQKARGKTSQNIIFNFIEKIENAIDKGDLGALTKIDYLVKHKKKLGTKNLYFLSKYLISIANRLNSKNKIDSAILILENSILLSPDLPDPHFILADIYINKNFLDIKNWIGEALSGGRLYLKRNNNKVGAHAITILAVAIFSMFVFIFFILFVKYFKNIFSDLSGFLSTPVLPHRVTQFFTFLIMLSFLTVGGIFLFLFTVPVFLWGYLEKQGRSIIIIFYIFLALTPSIIRSVAKRTTYANSMSYMAFKDMTQDTWSDNSFEELKKMEESFSDNWIITFCLGTIYKKKGNFTKSIDLFNSVIARNKNNYQMMVNMGNALFNSGKFDDAIKYYKRSLEIEKNNFNAHFNLGQVYAEKEKLDAAANEFESAMKIDSKKATYYMRLEDDHFNQKMLDYALPKEALREIKGFYDKEVDVTYHMLWNVVFGKAAKNRFALYMLISMIAIAAYYRLIVKKEGYSALCKDCGAVFKSKIFGKDKEQNKCNDCITVDIKFYDIDVMIRKEIANKIEHYEKVNKSYYIILNLLFPGSGKIFFRNEIKGGVILLFTFLFILEINFQIFLSRSENNAYLISLFLLSGLYWIISNIVLLRQKKAG